MIRLSSLFINVIGSIIDLLQSLNIPRGIFISAIIATACLVGSVIIVVYIVLASRGLNPGVAI